MQRDSLSKPVNYIAWTCGSRCTPHSKQNTLVHSVVRFSKSHECRLAKHTYGTSCSVNPSQCPLDANIHQEGRPGKFPIAVESIRWKDRWRAAQRSSVTSKGAQLSGPHRTAVIPVKTPQSQRVRSLNPTNELNHPREWYDDQNPTAPCVRQHNGTRYIYMYAFSRRFHPKRLTSTYCRRTHNVISVNTVTVCMGKWLEWVFVYIFFENVPLAWFFSCAVVLSLCLIEWERRHSVQVRWCIMGDLCCSVIKNMLY